MTFSADLTRLIERAKDRQDEVCRSVVLWIDEGLVEKSPVGNPDLWKSPAPKGYVGGTFRGNWQVGVNAIPSGVKDTPDPSGRIALSHAQAAVRGGKAGDVFWIVNNSPYAIRLEYGHSTQAPHPPGMVGATVAEFGDYVAKALRGAP